MQSGKKQTPGAGDDEPSAATRVLRPCFLDWPTSQ
ncbi:MAG: hypothetical protein JWN37_577 [Candidatus Nomurabacteria bacterium]|nr:hypothetical protein [Candidatus Nomurabacteria bacterium]